MRSNRIPYLTIVAAKAGDSEAMTAILIHFAPYIRSCSKRTFYDEHSNRYEFVDDEIRQRIEVKLMMGIVYKYDPDQLPPGESLPPDEWD